MKTHKHILRLILLALLAVMTVAPARAQMDSVYAGQTTLLSVIDLQGDTYSWDLYHEVSAIDFAATSGNCPDNKAFFAGGISTGPSVSVTWLKPGEYFYKVTAIKAGCTNNLKVGRVTVIEAKPSAILAINPAEICAGQQANLLVTFTGKAPWRIKLQLNDSDSTTIREYSGISATSNPFIIPVGPLITTGYTVVELADSLSVQNNPSNSVSLAVNPLPRSSRIFVKSQFNPAFHSDHDPYIADMVCKGSNRLYRIAGEGNSAYTWILRDTSGTAIPLLKPEGTPFTESDALSNAVYGSEIEINLDIDYGTYTLTALQTNDKGCQSVESASVIIVPQARTFAGNDLTLCSGDIVTLSEATANDYASLKWSAPGDGVFNDTTLLNPTYTPGPNDKSSGAFSLILTATGLGYPGSCSNSSDTVDFIVKPILTPGFAAIGPLCQNSLAPVLPFNSENGVTGIWNPAIIRTDSIGTITYLFTPDPNQCAVSTAMEITITAPAVPLFVAPGPYCKNAAADTLALTSTNGISGTWNPAVIRTDSVGTMVYTFTPDSAQCASVATIAVTVTEPTVPMFAALGPYCKNAAADTLALVSNNGISGTWSPAVIRTDSVGTTVYTFTPDSAQCASVATITVTVTEPTVPMFAALGPYCKNAAADTLALTSTNGISGTWNPAVIRTDSVGTTVYTFTPDSAQCATVTTMSVTVGESIEPLFAALGPYCKNAVADTLALISTNGISGTWNPAVIRTDSVGTTVYTFTPDSAQCATVATMSVTIGESIEPIFAALGPYCKNAVADTLALTSTNGISGTWNPSVIRTDSVGTTVYTFTPDSGQCATVTTMSVTVGESIEPLFAALGPYCKNAVADTLALISNNGISGTWNPAVIRTDSIGTTVYTFTPDSAQCATVTTMSVTIGESIEPIFAALGPYCKNAVAETLALVSNNGISGTWNPAVIRTDSIGTTVYTFTPDSAQCATVTTMSVTVGESIEPLFAALGPYCKNAVADTLALVSNNGISGTWNPAVIRTDSVGTTTYTFTPDAGQCATVTTMSVTVGESIEPLFVALGPYCKNAVADTLALVSNNGISGTWNPAVIRTDSVGTTTYTFTPDAGQCASVTTMSVTVGESIEPLFAALGPYCKNAVADTLALVSTNGISGTWNPAVIRTDSIGTTVYTFTPDSAQCATVTTMSVTVGESIEPLFAALGPYCKNAVADTLALISTNGISGTWKPAVIRTDSVGTTVYTFTPDSAQCATVTTMSVTVGESIEPLFAALGPFCKNAAADTLALTSTNGISGTWNPAVIRTASVGTTVYTFTPDSAQCAMVTTMSVTVGESIEPLFAALGPYCKNAVADTLALVSTNGITGTWSPAVIRTDSVGTTVYTFTPDSAQCATVTTMSVTVGESIEPLFAALGPYCKNAVADTLALVSNNGISGTWNPAVIRTDSVGTTVYTFTPDAGQCASVVNLVVSVNESFEPVFAALGPYLNAIAGNLPAVSSNGITGSWSPTTISATTTGTTTYTFTPDSGQCASVATMNITVGESIEPIFAVAHTYCLNATPNNLSSVSTNGITGSWSPAFINTSALGTTTYTFTPDAGQCATGITLEFTITESTETVVAALGPYCQNAVADTLTLVSTNGITGTWNPAVIRTDSVGTTVYTFTPDAGQCASVVTINITITPGIVPEFDAMGPFDLNATPPVLVKTSKNGITGQWNPSVINTAVSGSFNYVFTPDAGQCADSLIMNILVDVSHLVTINPVAPVCSGSEAVTLTGIPEGGTFSGPGVSGNQFNPSWVSPGIHLITYAYTDPSGWSNTATIEITVKAPPTLTITNPPAACGSGTVDLTRPAITAGSSTGISLTYWLDAAATSSLTDPTSVMAGTYYIKAVSSAGCYDIKPVTVSVTREPVLVITEPAPVCEGSTVNLTLAAITTGSDTGLSFTYWKDAAATIFCSTPAAATAGLYYIKGTTAGGCSAIKPIHVNVSESVGSPVFYGVSTTRCQGAGTGSYPAMADNTTALTYYLDGASIAGGNTINSSDGTVTYVASWTGISTISAVAEGCNGPKTTKLLVTTTTAATAAIAYSGTPFCKSIATKQPVTLTGTTGGTYSAIPSGLEIDPATGAITPESSMTGTYTVTYTVSSAGGCGEVHATTQVTISNGPEATITYPGSPYCASGNPIEAVISGDAGGTFTAAPAGLIIDAKTGTITPVSGSEGTYTITYTITAAGGCKEFTTATTITLNRLPDARFVYAGNPFCVNGSDPEPAYSDGAVAGTFTSTAGLVFIDAATGQVDLSASVPGTYVVTNTIPAANGCSEVKATTEITINRLPSATFIYESTPYCSNASDPLPTLANGSEAGVFTSAPGLVFIDIHTGQIDLSASVAGTYTVTNTIAANGACGEVSSTTVITINQAPEVSISYPGNPFCQTSTTNQAVALTGTSGGTFTVSPAGLSMNTLTGSINPAASTPGIYLVTYTIESNGPCGTLTATTTVRVTTSTVAISYPASVLCSSASPIAVTLTGTSGGVFTAVPAGLTLDATSGEITPGTSQAGTYTVTYTNAGGGCGTLTATAKMTITTAPQAVIAYAGSPFCTSVDAPQPVALTGTTGGIYSATPAGLSIDPVTGTITPSTSVAGNYLVTYFIAATGGCDAFSATTPVTLSTKPSASIYYPGAPFCSSLTSAKVALTGTPGGRFEATPAGLTINDTTGEITPSGSTAGTYQVSYTLKDEGCGEVKSTVTITILQAPVATISYTGSPFCPEDGQATPLLTGATGGFYTALPAGLTIDRSTGTITPGTSMPGTYVVSYSLQTSDRCGVLQTTAEVTVNARTLVTTSPADQDIVYPASTGFGVVATGSGLTYQWQVDSGNGFVNLADTAVYSGAFTDSLSLASPPVSMNGYKYRVIVSGSCFPPVISEAATLMIRLKEYILMVSAEGMNKVYDGTTEATVTLSDNRKSGDEITVTYTHATFDSRDAGTGKSIMVHGISISGRDADKYGYNTIATTHADIAPKPILIIADAGLSKVYGDADPVFTYTFSPDLVAGDSFTGELTRMAGENPGLYGIQQGTLTPGSNYTTTFISKNFEIRYKTLIHITISAGQTKVYGNADPELSFTYNPALEAGDSFSGKLARAAGENIGEYQISRGTLVASPKYGISLEPSAFVITPKPIMVTAVADIKVYDGTIASDKAPAISTSLAFNDASSFTQTYDVKDIGTGKTMTPSGKVSDGNNGLNYTVTFASANVGTITPKPITGSFTVADKKYDATTEATILTRTLSGAIDGDNVRYVLGTATFETPETGFNKVVNGTGFSLAGIDAPNYMVNETASTFANILALEVGSVLVINSSTFTHYSDQVTLTATIPGGAPLANGKQAASSVTFRIEGSTIRDRANNPDIPLMVSGSDLIATITVPILETTVTGSMVPGTKEATATFNNENDNYQVTPNPAKSSFDFAPGFDILAFPNPSPGPVSFKVSVDVGTITIIDLYTADGQLVERVFEGFIPTGESKTIIYKGHLAQGLYRYRAMIGNEVKMGNLIIIGVY